MRTKSAIDCFYTCKHFHRLHSLFPLFPFRAPCSPFFVLSLFNRSGSASYFQPVNDVAYRWRWLLCVYNQMHCYASARVLSLSRIAFLFFPLVFVFFGFCSFCLGVSFFWLSLKRTELFRDGSLWLLAGCLASIWKLTPRMQRQSDIQGVSWIRMF